MSEKTIKKLTDRFPNTALQESEKLLRGLARRYPYGAVLLFDEQLQLMMLEGAGLADLGLVKEDLEDRSCWNIFLPETGEILLPHFQAALAGKSDRLEILNNGRTYHVIVQPVWNDQGEIIAGVAVFQDVTPRARRQPG